MNHTERLTRYVANFVDELAKNGLSDVVISPGSRSTPLAMTLTEHEGINTWIHIDERSAAFFALGMAKQTKHPVAMVCTSGTAAANYFPAIVEAYYSRVPLVILTADRPHELRDVGAPQAIEQIKLYGDYVKWFHEMALPEASSKMLNYARSKAARALYLAQEGNAGPVHLNFPLREPLVPDFSIKQLWEQEKEDSYHPAYVGEKILDEPQLKQLLDDLKNKKRGLFVCGPQVSESLAEAITTLALRWNIPILADPLSQIRSGKHDKNHIIDGYDSFLRHEAIRKQLEPDFIIRFGAMPVSKAYLFYVKDHHQTKQFIVEENEGFREPAGNQSTFIFANPILLCKDLTVASEEINCDPHWIGQWREMNTIAQKELFRLKEKNEKLTEGEAIRLLFEVVPEESTLYVGNSMAIRDVDTFFMTTSKTLRLLANRGANGIDGMVSSSLGAAASGEHITLVIGDLSFFHDLNGLLVAKHYQLNITILLINNNGGGIFSFLPQAGDDKHFEALFGTPIDIDFKHAVTMYGGNYSCVLKEEELRIALHKSYKHKGINIIEVKTDRTENLKWHQSKWRAIENEILNREW
ncbi:2-succinyl-5-enolpyruvyl-6-hydroxy-3-cyclohexene-1-carboxylic-acid synthase [Virgibacillus alimentarius]|uniref:2-succinyl-5-enolpyruvyl-6-hydroxy-3- cyclohexene-1-carboxylic-acid synthase n=1 Tax=Virgibacillus alimentarius TaxID=698769 RepID=UPI000493A54D|nr:2-succinyl-5-enolpyruvyl-6-hydroxy-3-cyclohexene-1-carboxylic-acid synthase [Virgibacillus alimentarius]